MKKGVALLVFLIGVLTVFLVGIVGTNPIGIEAVVYISSVTIKDMNGDAIEKKPSGNKVLPLTFKADVTDEKGVSYMYYVFNTEILPANATHSSILYWCAASDYVYFARASSSSLPSEGEPAQTSTTGQLVIKEMSKEKPEEDAYYLMTISVKANDGGKAGVEDSLQLVIKY